MRINTLLSLSFLCWIFLANASSCHTATKEIPALSTDDINSTSVRILVESESQTEGFTHGHSFILIGEGKTSYSYHFAFLDSFNVLTSQGLLYKYMDYENVNYIKEDFNTTNLKAFLIKDASAQAITQYVEAFLANSDNSDPTYADVLHGNYHLITNNCTTFITDVLAHSGSSYTTTSPTYEYPDGTVNLDANLAPFTLMTDLIKKSRSPELYKIYDVTELTRVEMFTAFY